MKVIKRNGNEVDFEWGKVKKAVEAAFSDTGERHNINRVMHRVDKDLAKEFAASKNTLHVEDIQDVIETDLMRMKHYETAKNYVRYRHKHELDRQVRNDDELLSMLGGENEYWHTENSNKNAEWVTTQRDYMAGIISKDLTKTYVLPKELWDAHEQGIIHIHDTDYWAQPMTNCCLCNLEDMLQNGTVINGVKIDKPHRLITAATLASQIIAAVSSSQWGGTTITLTHLAPFVRDSYNFYYQKYKDWGFPNKKSQQYANEDLKKEVRDSMQTLIYQLNSLTTTNG
jgi:ribonucleoside-triphosphate reductase